MCRFHSRITIRSLASIKIWKDNKRKNRPKKSYVPLNTSVGKLQLVSMPAMETCKSTLTISWRSLHLSDMVRLWFVTLTTQVTRSSNILSVCRICWKVPLSIAKSLSIRIGMTKESTRLLFNSAIKQTRRSSRQRSTSSDYSMVYWLNLTAGAQTSELIPFNMS